MGDTLSVYNLGEMGVNVDTTPIHGSDGELIQAQNAQFDVSGNKGGLRKRFGMTKLNANSLGSAIQGATDVQLPDPNAGLLQLATDGVYYANCDVGAPGVWVRATPGPTGLLSPANTTTVPAHAQKYATIGVDELALAANIAGLSGRLYFPGREGVGEDYVISASPPTIRRFDGVLEGVVCRVPYNPNQGAGTFPRAVGDMHVFDNVLYFVSIDVTGAGTSRARVFGFDPVTETLTQIGNAWGASAGELGSGNQIPIRLWNFMGFLWAFTYAASGVAHAFYIRPGIDSAWTDDKTFGASEVPIAATTGKSLMVVGIRGATKKCYTRDGDGVWTAVTVDLSASPSTVAAAQVCALGYVEGFTNPLFMITRTPHASAGQDRFYFCTLTASAIVAVAYSSYEIGTSVGDERNEHANVCQFDKWLGWSAVKDLAGGTGAFAARAVRSALEYLTAPTTVLEVAASTYNTDVGRPYIGVLIP